MAQILLALNKYIPTENTEVSIEVDGTSYVQQEARVWPRIIFGDQLISACVRGAIALRCFHKTSITRLDGHEALACKTLPCYHKFLQCLTINRFHIVYLGFAKPILFCRQGYLVPAETGDKPYFIWEGI